MSILHAKLRTILKQSGMSIIIKELEKQTGEKIIMKENNIVLKKKHSKKINQFTMKKLPVVFKYSLRQTYVRDPTKTRPTMLVGDFIKYRIPEVIGKKKTTPAMTVLKFKDSSSIKLTDEQLSSLEADSAWVISEQVPLSEEDIFDFQENNTFTKKTIARFLTEICGIKLPDFDHIIAKINQDSYTTAGYQRCINIREWKKFKYLLNEGKTKTEIEELEASSSKKGNSKCEGKCIHCGPIFNRRPRCCTSKFNPQQEETFLRSDKNFGMLPQGVKTHEWASVKTSNGLVFKLLSQITRLKDLDVITECVNPIETRSEIFLKLLEMHKVMMYEKDYSYIKNYHKQNKYTIDFLTHEIMTVADFNKQNYKSKEHGINFCHVLPQAGTTVSNCNFAGTKWNRYQSDQTKEALLALNLMKLDYDGRRAELVNVIRKNDPVIDMIFTECESTKVTMESIEKIKTHLANQLY